MASYNVFAPKKPKYLQTGYGLQTTSTPASSAYSSPSTMTSSTAKTAAPIASYKYSTPTQPTTPRINYSLTSGTTAKSAVNPTNYVAPTAPPAAKVDPSAQYLSDATKMGQSRMGFVRGQGDQQADYIKKQYELANKGLQDQAGNAEVTFNQFKGDTEASIKDLLAGGERQKSQAKDYYGEAQRLAAKTRNETRGQTQRTFANLGTIDSRGEGSFQQATENQDSEFNSFTQKNLREQADKLAQIDETVATAERTARTAISTKQQELVSLKQKIELATAQNNLDQAQELTAAYNATQDLIYQIEDSVSQLQYAHSVEKQRLESAIAEMQNAPGGELKDKQALAVSAQDSLDNLMFQIQNNPNIYKNLNPLDQSKRGYDAAVNNAIDLIIRTRTGAAATKQEVEAMRSLFPQYMDSPELAKQKLQQLRSGLQSNLYGTDFQNKQPSQPTMDQYLSGNDPLGLGF